MSVGKEPGEQYLVLYAGQASATDREILTDPRTVHRTRKAIVRDTMETRCRGYVVNESSTTGVRFENDDPVRATLSGRNPSG